jgi:TM2 domain-containing membrane protein YozV
MAPVVQGIRDPRRVRLRFPDRLHAAGWFMFQETFDMNGQGSTGNVIAALCSFFVPGLGQLIQGRLLMAAIQFVLAGALWFILMGWIIHLWSIIDAARYKPPFTVSGPAL